MFKGNLTALITPFKNNTVDEDTFARFVDWQISQGVHGLVPCGTTGESVTLSTDEFKRVIEICVKTANKRVPVVAGSGTNCTEKTISFSRIAKEAGADALLIVAPYYNNPTQDGLYAHYKAIHDATDLPILLYDIPGRSVVEIAVPTIAKLSVLPRIVGVKDATSRLHKPLQIKKHCGADFCQLSGDDATCFAHLAQGGVGCISVTSNIAPKLSAEMQNAWMKGDVKTAQRINESLQPLREALFCESSPAPAKFAAELLGFGSCEPRLPLVAASASARERVKECMSALNLL
jgi:4-hydroxy-tetrahydrodipicolinate synthase